MKQFRSAGRTKSPCYGCENRQAGCHAECEDYIQYKAIHDEEIETIRANKQKNARQHYMTDKEFRNALSGRNKNRVFKQTIK
jgi:hypothetical protein